MPNIENKGKLKVGLICAIELDAVFSYYKNVIQMPSPAGFKLYRIEKETCELYVLHTGMGEIAASAGVQYLITAENVTVIVNFGVVGGLTGDMRQHKVCVVNNVVHYKYDCSEFLDLAVGQVDGHDSVYLPTDRKLLEKALAVNDTLIQVTCCSGDKFVGTAEEKNALHLEFKADICDMESAGIVLACEINSVPCLLLKAVSDGLADGAEGFFDALQNASKLCLEITDKIIDGFDR